MKKIKLSQLKNILNLQKSILDHFRQVAGIKDTQKLNIEIIYAWEENESVSDNDHSHVRVRITHRTGGLGKLEAPINIVNIHEKIHKLFYSEPTISQKMTGSSDHPRLETTFTFSYYNFTKK